MSSAKLFEMQTLWCSKTKNPEMVFAVKTEIQQIAIQITGIEEEGGTSWIYVSSISRIF